MVNSPSPFLFFGDRGIAVICLHSSLKARSKKSHEPPSGRQKGINGRRGECELEILILGVFCFEGFFAAACRQIGFSVHRGRFWFLILGLLGLIGLLSS